MPHSTIVMASEEGTRLDKYLAAHNADISRNRIQHLIETGQVQVNKVAVVSCAARIKAGDAVAMTVPPPIETDMRPADIPLDILFEDAHMLVVNKPAGLTVHPGAGNHHDTMANALLSHCGGQLSGIGGVCRPGIVHRLDKDTSGLLVVAKTDQAHQHLSAQIASRSLKRQYIAVAWGVLHPSMGTITGNIARSTRDRTRMAVVQTGGKDAITHYRVKEILAGGEASIVECRLQTGRTHQIRLHFSNQGHALIGDPVYGGKHKRLTSLEAQAVVSDFKRQALHSRRIGFIHPETGGYLEYQAPLPEDMRRLIESLR